MRCTCCSNCSTILRKQCLYYSISMFVRFARFNAFVDPMSSSVVFPWFLQFATPTGAMKRRLVVNSTCCCFLFNWLWFATVSRNNKPNQRPIIFSSHPPLLRIAQTMEKTTINDIEPTCIEIEQCKRCFVRTIQQFEQHMWISSQNMWIATCIKYENKSMHFDIVIWSPPPNREHCFFITRRPLSLFTKKIRHPTRCFPQRHRRFG